MSSSFLTSLRSARHRSNTLTHFFVLLWVFLFWLFTLISSKSVASICGNLAEDSIWNSELSKGWREKSGNSAIINTKQNPASDDRSLTFERSDNSCNLIGQYSVHLFILTFDWLMESIQIFLKLDGLFKAEGNAPAKTIQFILNLDSWQKLIKNRSVGNIGFWCSYIITIGNLPLNRRSLSFLVNVYFHNYKISNTLCFLSYINIDNKIQAFIFLINSKKPFLQALLLTDCNSRNNVISPK